MIRDGDIVELTSPATTLKDPGRKQRTLPVGTRAMVERQSLGLLRLSVLDPSPDDGRHDAAVVSSSRVKRV